MACKLDYRTRGDVLGEISVEMGHEDLQRICDARAVLEPAGGEGPQARLAGTTVEGLDRDRRYALVWPEVC